MIEKRENAMDPRQHYIEQGYVIFENLIPTIKIDRVLNSLEKFKERRLPYFSQSIHNWIRPKIDGNGLMQESMENFTNLFISAGLNKAGMDIILGNEIENALKKIHPEFESFILWQNMLFDRSTGTVDHYDSWYLDTMPRGYLTAAWIALENISEESGPFRYYPKSHLQFLEGSLDKLSHEEFIRQSRKYAENNNYKSALLKKGDVLFWHPALIHGALSQVKPEYSRKSLTSHYYPTGVSRRDNDKRVLASSIKIKISEILKIISYPNKIKNYPIYSSHTKINIIRFNVVGLINVIKNSITRTYKVKMDMRRNSYKNTTLD